MTIGYCHGNPIAYNYHTGLIDSIYMMSWLFSINRLMYPWRYTENYIIIVNTKRYTHNK